MVQTLYPAEYSQFGYPHQWQLQKTTVVGQLVESHSVKLYPLDFQELVTAWLWVGRWPKLAFHQSTVVEQYSVYCAQVVCASLLVREVEANISPSYFEHVPWSATTQQMVTHLLFITIIIKKDFGYKSGLF